MSVLFSLFLFRPYSLIFFVFFLLSHCLCLRFSVENLLSRAQNFRFRRFFSRSCVNVKTQWEKTTRTKSKSVPSAKRTGIIQSIWYQRRQLQPLQQSQNRNGGGLLLLKCGQKMNVEGIYILQSYYFVCVYKEHHHSGHRKQMNPIWMFRLFEFSNKKIFSRFRFGMTTVSRAGRMRSRDIAVAFILRRHHYTQPTSNFPGCKNLDTRLNHNHLIAGIGSTFVRSKMCTGKRYHLVWHCVFV